MDDAEQLMPAYLRFVRGVIDSADLPLNVSREILQQSKDVETIRAASVKRVLSLLDDLVEHQPGKYATFWKEFGRTFKEGVGEDAANRTHVAKLLRFASTRADVEEQTVSLSDYAGRMKEGQGAIYYITADSFPAARNSPHLEVFRKVGVEVLLMYDRVDEWVVSLLEDFEGTPLRSVARGDLDLGSLAPQVETPAAEAEQAGVPICSPA
jgi:molecular chaperone HtpG